MLAPTARVWLVRLGLGLAAAAIGAASLRAAPSDSTSLAATTAAPWNPPGVIAASEPWEAVVRFPGRLVSLPLAGLGQGVRIGLLAAERNFVAQRIHYQLLQVPLPVTIGPAGLGDRTGFGGRVAYDQSLAHAHWLAAIEASQRGYVRLRAEARAGLLQLAYREERRPSDRYFGRGIGSRESDESRYGLLEHRLRAELDLATDVRRGAHPRGALSMWAGPRWSRLTQGWGVDEASIAANFPTPYLGLIDREVEHFTWGSRLAIDQRDGEPHWTHGWRAAVQAERFDRPLRASPSRTGAQFTRVELRAEGGVSLMRDPRTLRLSVSLVNDEVGHDPERMLPEDEARLGGAQGLAGYESQRFHDFDALNARLSYIFPLAQFLEMDLHGDTGGVFAHVMDDARWNRLRQSAGIAVRARTARAVIGSFGVDFGPEKTRIVFSILSDS